MEWIAAIVALAWLRPLWLVSLQSLHILQLEEYQTGRFWRWMVGHAATTQNAMMLGSLLGSALLALVLPAPFWVIGPVACLVLGSWQTRTLAQPEARKPLVFTARVRRLVVGWWVLAVVLVAVFTELLSHQLTQENGLLVGRAGGPVAAVVLGVAFVLLVAWPLVSVANLLLYPVEEGFRQYYLRSAAARIRRFGPRVIGVTGSYGKTSTKAILTQILSTKYSALQTPRSFNTPMGLCRVIREQLQPEHQYFVVEMGAYGRGEIRRLCHLVGPSVGILTAIGPQHLERFGTIETVAQAKWELVEALPVDGLAVLNGEDPRCRALAPRARCTCLLVGDVPSDSGLESYLRADDVKLSPDGLHFTLRSRDGEAVSTRTQLLGRHNVTNILTAAVVALHCGMSLNEIAVAVETLEPIEHRLQLVPNDNGIVVIDDGYNSNPRGAAGALEVLAAFTGGRRYLVTPGMVELGPVEVDEHRKFGERAASVCDGVILIGPKRTRPIAEGLVGAGFASDRVIVTRSLAEAQEHLRILLRRGDVVLFENDLPDTYVE